MHFRKCSGYVVYPLFAVLFLVPSAMRAQDAAPQQPAVSAQDQSDQSQAPPQQSVEVLREAQARVNARRQERIRQIVQDTYSHKYELDFGGGYLRLRPGTNLQHVSETAWNLDITDYIRGDWGVTADFRGYYGTTFTGPNAYSVFSPSISQYTFMAGPRYRFYKGQHWGWTADLLAGAGHGNFGTGTGGLPPQYVGLYKDGTVLNVSPGASVDYNVSPTLALRLTPNALITNYGGEWQENLGWNLGVVYRFGRKK